MCLREEEAAVEDRQGARNDDIARAHVAAVSANDARFSLLDVEDTRALEDVVAVAGQRLREREEVFARVELRLVVEAERSGDRERKRCLLDVRGGQPELLFDFDLALDLLDIVARFGVDVV